MVAACRGRIALLSEITLLPVIQRRVEPLVVLDLGVPRNLEPYLADQDGLEVIVLDQLHLQMRERYRQRGDALLQARQIVGHEVLRFEQWRSELPVRPIRAEMYASVETVLSKWRTEQPGAVRHLRAAIHRGLEQAFGTLGLPAGVSRPPCQHS